MICHFIQEEIHGIETRLNVLYLANSAWHCSQVIFLDYYNKKVELRQTANLTIEDIEQIKKVRYYL